jgi:predicted DNA-binding ArsR family transcriptional regulator
MVGTIDVSIEAATKGWYRELEHAMEQAIEEHPGKDLLVGPPQFIRTIAKRSIVLTIKGQTMIVGPNTETPAGWVRYRIPDR